MSPANEGEEMKLEALGREETFSRHAPSVHPAVCKELEDNILVVNAMNRQRGSGMILSGWLARNVFQDMDEIKAILQRFV